MMFIKRILIASLSLVVVGACGEKKKAATEVQAEKEQAGQSPEEKESTAQQKAAPDTEAVIEKIRGLYAETEKKLAGKSLTVKEFRFSCPDLPEMGHVQYFFDGDEPIKINFNHGYEHGGYTKQYFLKEGEVYFAFISSNYWTFSEKTDVTDEAVEEQRVYFSEGKAVQCLFKSFKYKSNEENPSDKIPNKKQGCPPELLKTVENDIKLLLSLKNTTEEEMGCIYPD